MFWICSLIRRKAGGIEFVRLQILLGVALVIFLAGCSKDKNQMAPKDETPTGLDPFVQNARLGRGMNLGNALEAPNEGDWGVVIKSEYFDLIKNAGFNSVRIPIRWSAHAGTSSPYIVAQSFLGRVDWVIEQAFARKLAVVINMHHYEEIMQDPTAHKARFLAIWEQVAKHYQNYSGDLIFEILNEPNGSLTIPIWNQFLKDAIVTIRRTNPGRTLMVGPANWYSMTSLNSLDLPADDKNIIVSVHYYNPFQFTHQGAEWVTGSDAWLGTRWLGTAQEKQAIARDFSTAAGWGTSNNRPLNLGEFGAYNKADMQSRALWTEFVARTAEANNMSWHYWEFIAGFGVYNGTAKDWNYPLLYALIPKS
ncbi:MAG: glycoside hydrolase family 5 protein [candidate division KSB1 bacterium]|nr:glycoside hydrolase family 5 protein [candidate division KSB1 bacterium]MDZ7301885.1 glycoside hydrolase family 5 protein [candidate division KSB1 bacterium]MDZ7310268.1 glycoside hydrolase family 5 protein [candidate division KSB1 bacterium]